MPNIPKTADARGEGLAEFESITIVNINNVKGKLKRVSIYTDSTTIANMYLYILVYVDGVHNGWDGYDLNRHFARSITRNDSYPYSFDQHLNAEFTKSLEIRAMHTYPGLKFSLQGSADYILYQ
ncbi:hypothetical protein D3P09_11780 [Paenibacillus pinisoli]|uniref:Uncharacterized protein n=1 Tax=Paenibacillus pinisoli TaxID=1276110 RepID=A0A3A6PL56_9BACL|nr:hypothetical protein [Paenibacillus pinisoli]RJX40048.1 hypothetical protein D3P09_11780 [Paenibacillus pinisoli]